MALKTCRSLLFRRCSLIFQCGRVILPISRKKSLIFRVTSLIFWRKTLLSPEDLGDIPEELSADIPEESDPTKDGSVFPVEDIDASGEDLNIPEDDFEVPEGTSGIWEESENLQEDYDALEYEFDASEDGSAILEQESAANESEADELVHVLFTAASSVPSC